MGSILSLTVGKLYALFVLNEILFFPYKKFIYLILQSFLLLILLLGRMSAAYDPKDDSLKDILLPEGEFEAFYLRGMQQGDQGAARPPHLHGSFNQYRNPALVGVPNSAAYGFRFDGKRRFNYD